MNSKRLFFVLLGVIALLFIALVAGVYGINNLLGQQANKLTALKANSLALDQEQVSLAKAKKDIKKYADLEKIAKSVVPEDKSQAEAVREIANIAETNGVVLGGISFPPSSLSGGIASTGAAAAGSAGAAAGTSKTSALSQLQRIPSIPGVYQLLITVTSDSSRLVQYDKFIGFLGDLERNRRTAQVSSITLTPDKVDPNSLAFSLTLSEYIKP